MIGSDSGIMESLDYKQVFNANDPSVKNDMYQIIMDYLYKEKLYSTAVIFQDEANMRSNEASAKRSTLKLNRLHTLLHYYKLRSHTSRLKKLIINGDWDMVMKVSR